MPKRFFSADAALDHVINEFNSTIILSRRLGLNASIDRSHTTDSIEIWIRKPNDEILMVITADDFDYKLAIKTHRTQELTSKYKGKQVTKKWIEGFLEKWGDECFENKIIQYIKKSTHSKLNQSINQEVYYVYRHTFKNGLVYIGKGKNGRYLDTKNGRSQIYLDNLNNYGDPAKEILTEFLTEDKAYEIENEIIVMYRESNLPLLNITDGLELAGFGDMPWRTLLRENIEIDKLDKKFKKIIHLMKTTKPEIYLIGFTIISAAKEVKCSCNDILKLISADSRTLLNDFRVVADEEAAMLFPNYRLIIENKEEINLTYRVYENINS